MRLRIATGVAVVLVPALSAAAEPVFDAERLFTTSEQRQRLDRLRAQGNEVAGGKGDASASSARDRTDRATGPVEVHGYIRRSEGPSTYWVNGAASTAAAGLPEEIPLDSARLEGASLVVELPNGRVVRLQPGQRWDPEAGGVVESYDR